MISAPLKDTANPLSHHVMASSNVFNSTQALAPVNTKSIAPSITYNTHELMILNIELGQTIRKFLGKH